MLAVFGLGELLWSMLVFFFWVMAIWVFIGVFTDIFHRDDLSGAAKAGWLLLIFVLPFIGALIYMATRPARTARDREDMQRMRAMQRTLGSYSASEEIQKLVNLRDAGEISAEEYEQMKRDALTT